MVSALLLLRFFLISSGNAAAVKYVLDSTWKPQFPSGSNTFSAVGVSTTDYVFVTQRGNASIPPVFKLGLDGSLISSWGEHTVALAKTNTWGAHGIAIEDCAFICAPGDKDDTTTRVWVEDFTNHTVTAFSSSGTKLIQIGTPGVAGNGTNPPQFGNVADAVIVTGSLQIGKGFTPSIVYATDGDGGNANRVMKIRVPNYGPSMTPTTEWATGHVFHDPHSIALHTRSQLLVIADREHMALKLIDAKNGEVLGTFDCGISFGSAEYGVPFGVRAHNDQNGGDLLFVASMDNPQDHKNQKISVLDVSGLNRQDGVHSNCSALQTISIDPHDYSGPHLLGVDPIRGDLYVALVADSPLSTVLKYKNMA